MSISLKVVGRCALSALSVLLQSNFFAAHDDFRAAHVGQVSYLRDAFQAALSGFPQQHQPLVAAMLLCSSVAHGFVREG